MGRLAIHLQGDRLAIEGGCNRLAPGYVASLEDLAEGEGDIGLRLCACADHVVCHHRSRSRRSRTEQQHAACTPTQNLHKELIHGDFSPVPSVSQ
ncbi:hypothetical protein GCM10009121_25010 [Rhodanobacter soli]